MTADAMVRDVSKDRATAGSVQQRFMQSWDPALDPLGYRAGCRQVLELGGDCYGFVPLSDQRWALAIADASARRLPATLWMANVQLSVRTAALFAGNDPAAVVRAVNRQVHASSLAHRYATLFYGIFDIATRTLLESNAVHPAPMVIRQDGPVI